MRTINILWNEHHNIFKTKFKWNFLKKDTNSAWNFFMKCGFIFPLCYQFYNNPTCSILRKIHIYKYFICEFTLITRWENLIIKQFFVILKFIRNSLFSRYLITFLYKLYSIGAIDHFISVWSKNVFSIGFNKNQVW